VVATPLCGLQDSRADSLWRSVITMGTITRSRESEAFFDARQYTEPEGLSACEGWTAHDMTAHLAATAAEVTRHRSGIS
jgi:hypothetical protein